MISKRRKSLTIGIAAAGMGVVAVALIIAATWQPTGDGQSDRQEEVAERGEEVMPFDLEQTSHHFTPTDTGGVQDVVADRPGDTEQIGLIRAHLQKEAEAFRRGDFGDPAKIHGATMPGLAQLEDGYTRIEVGYQDRPDGATLTYSTEDPTLIDALHDWFEAQLSDHGDHAESGH